jgi:3-oxoacyl-[acyl-carrier-protein] synthase-1
VPGQPATVAQALRECHSSIRAIPDYAERGLRSQLVGVPQIYLDAAAYAYVAMRAAIADAGLAIEHVRRPAVA